MPTPEFLIRQATSRDVPALAVLASEAFRDTYRDIDDPQDIDDYVQSELTPSYFKSHVNNPRSSLLVVERDRDLIGYALVTRSSAPPCVQADASAELARLYLRQDVKGRGLGSALLRAALEEARKLPASAIWLGVYDKNLRARDFYSRWGFVDVGTKDFAFGGQTYADPVMCRTITDDP